MLIEQFGIRFCAAFAALSLAACNAGLSDEAGEDVATASFEQALSLGDIAPQLESLDPFRVRFPAETLRPILAGEILAALQANAVADRETKLHVDEVNVDFGVGEITVKAKGEGGVRKCVKILNKHHCSPWISSTVRATVTLGLGVRNWIVQAEHRHTDVSASNDGVDALIRAFHGKVYGPINDGIKKALASTDGRNLRAELESKLMVSVPPEAVVNVHISVDGVVLEATAAPPPVGRTTYLKPDEFLRPGDFIRAENDAFAWSCSTMET